MSFLPPRVGALAFLLGGYLALTAAALGAVRLLAGGAALAALVVAGLAALVGAAALRPRLMDGGRWFRVALPLAVLALVMSVLAGGWARAVFGVVVVLLALWLAARPAWVPRQVGADLWGWLLVFPALALMVLWHFAPAMYAFWLSLFDDVNFVRQASFAGVQNYVIALTRDPQFWRALLHSAWFTVISLPLSIFLAAFTAILLNERVRFLGVFRTLYFLPYVTALTAVAAVWRWIYDPNFGLLNSVLHTPGQEWLANPSGVIQLLAGRLGVTLPEVLQGPSVALLAIIAVSVWHNLGYGVVIMLAGLQSVPPEYHEAAQMDGATWAQRVRFITWPLLSPTTFFLTITGLIGAFQVFTETFVMAPNNGAGVLNDTTTIVWYIYQKGFRDGNFSYASALAILLFLIVFAVTLWQNRVLARRVTYDL